MRKSPTDERLSVVERMIEGRLELIDRLFEDVRELTAERDRLAGRRSRLIGRLFASSPNR